MEDTLDRRWAQSASSRWRHCSLMPAFSSDHRGGERFRFDAISSVLYSSEPFSHSATVMLIRRPVPSPARLHRGSPAVKSSGGSLILT
jgi:hypothetical protein